MSTQYLKRLPLAISHSPGVLVMNSFHFCVSGKKSSLWPSFLKDILPGRILGLYNFSTIILKLFLYGLVLCIVSHEKSAFIAISVPSYTMSTFFSYIITVIIYFYSFAFKIFFSELVSSNLIMICFGVVFFIFLVLGGCSAS